MGGWQASALVSLPEGGCFELGQGLEFLSGQLARGREDLTCATMSLLALELRYDPRERARLDRPRLRKARGQATCWVCQGEKVNHDHRSPRQKGGCRTQMRRLKWRSSISPTTAGI